MLATPSRCSCSRRSCRGLAGAVAVVDVGRAGLGCSVAHDGTASGPRGSSRAPVSRTGTFLVRPPRALRIPISACPPATRPRRRSRRAHPAASQSGPGRASGTTLATAGVHRGRTDFGGGLAPRQPARVVRPEFVVSGDRAVAGTGCRHLARRQLLGEGPGDPRARPAGSSSSTASRSRSPALWRPSGGSCGHGAVRVAHRLWTRWPDRTGRFRSGAALARDPLDPGPLPPDRRRAAVARQHGQPSRRARWRRSSDATIASGEPPGRSTRPNEPAKSVSPL